MVQRSYPRPRRYIRYTHSLCAWDCFKASAETMDFILLSMRACISYGLGRYAPFVQYIRSSTRLTILQM
jgi:hypothetical protein